MQLAGLRAGPARLRRTVGQCQMHTPYSDYRVGSRTVIVVHRDSAARYPFFCYQRLPLPRRCVPSSSGSIPSSSQISCTCDARSESVSAGAKTPAQPPPMFQSTSRPARHPSPSTASSSRPPCRDCCTLSSSVPRVCACDIPYCIFSLSST